MVADSLAVVVPMLEAVVAVLPLEALEAAAVLAPSLEPAEPAAAMFWPFSMADVALPLVAMASQHPWQMLQEAHLCPHESPSKFSC